MTFEDVMLERLAECHAEACEEVIAGMKSGRSIGDAVADAIESLPASKTREIRRWLEDWEAWEEWKKYEQLGWSIKKKGSTIFLYCRYRDTSVTGPSPEAIAAGAGVHDIKYVGDASEWAGPTRPSPPSGSTLISQYVSRREANK